MLKMQWLCGSFPFVRSFYYTLCFFPWVPEHFQVETHPLNPLMWDVRNPSRDQRSKAGVCNSLHPCSPRVNCFSPPPPFPLPAFHIAPQKNVSVPLNSVVLSQRRADSSFYLFRDKDHRAPGPVLLCGFQDGIQRAAEGRGWFFGGPLGAADLIKPGLFCPSVL